MGKAAIPEPIIVAAYVGEFDQVILWDDDGEEGAAAAAQWENDNFQPQSRTIWFLMEVKT